MKHVVTSTGFEIDVDEQCIDDMELFDAVAESQKGNVIAVTTVIGKIFGERKQALYDHVRDESGRVPTQAVVSELTEVFEAIGEKK